MKATAKERGVVLQACVLESRQFKRTLEAVNRTAAPDAPPEETAHLDSHKSELVDRLEAAQQQMDTLSADIRRLKREVRVRVRVTELKFIEL